jgi:hypothetical protein
LNEPEASATAKLNRRERFRLVENASWRAGSVRDGQALESPRNLAKSAIVE